MRAIGAMLAVAGLGLAACCGDEPAAGCGSDVLEQRTYILCTPGGGEEAGLVVALHGRGSSAQDMRAVTRLEVAARAEGLAVVYPDAREGGWDGEDIAFLDELVAALDSGPVSLVGFSNGASMALRYAAARPDQVRAAVSVAGQLPVDPAAQPTGRVPLLEIYGTADPIRPYATGIPGQSLPTEATVAAFVAVAAGAEAGDPVETDAVPADGTRLRTQHWTDAAGVVATLVTVVDGGHTWPSSHGQFAGGEGFGVVSQELDASADAIAFVVGEARERHNAETDRVAGVVADAISHPRQDSADGFARAATNTQAGEDGRLQVIGIEELEADELVDPLARLTFLVSLETDPPLQACYDAEFTYYGITGEGPRRIDCPDDLSPVAIAPAPPPPPTLPTDAVARLQAALDGLPAVDRHNVALVQTTVDALQLLPAPAEVASDDGVTGVALGDQHSCVLARITDVVEVWSPARITIEPGEVGCTPGAALHPGPPPH